jgi:hypothetical protein
MDAPVKLNKDEQAQSKVTPFNRRDSSFHPAPAKPFSIHRLNRF